MKRLLVLLALLAACGGMHAPQHATPPAVDPDERTLWQICLDEDGQVIIPSDRPPHLVMCDDWEYIEYTLPIKVGLVNTDNLEYVHVAYDAIAQWNHWLEWDGFMQYTTGRPDILIGFYDSPYFGVLGQAVPMLLDDGWHCGAFTYTASNRQRSTLLHEIGHCMGLSHDGNVQVPDDYTVWYSVMKQGAKSMNYTLTGADKVALWNVYDAQ